jgi:F0F1-type ATP synthase delta subunit
MSLSRNLALHLTKHQDSLSDVIDLLTRYNMLSLLPSIKKALVEISQTGDVYNTIMIETPFPLSENAIKKIKRIAGNDLATHEVHENKELLAGFKARFKGVLYDGSAERIIKQLTR